jgi:hypothetical protein
LGHRRFRKKLCDSHIFYASEIIRNEIFKYHEIKNPGFCRGFLLSGRLDYLASLGDPEGGAESSKYLLVAGALVLLWIRIMKQASDALQ